MSIERRHSVSVAGVIVDVCGRALLNRRRDNGQWEPPGGVLEPNETIPDALQREVREETGMKIALPARLTGVYKNMTGLIVALVFRCEAIDGAPATGDGTRALKWVARDEVARFADEAYAIRVLDAMDVPAIPAVRAHDGVGLVQRPPTARSRPPVRTCPRPSTDGAKRGPPAASELSLAADSQPCPSGFSAHVAQSGPGVAAILGRGPGWVYRCCSLRRPVVRPFGLCASGRPGQGDTDRMALPKTHHCSACSDGAEPATVVHEDVVVGAPLSMDDLTEAQRLDRFSRKYAHDGCQVTEVVRIPHDSLSGYAWCVRFTESR